ncbi:protein kinase domain-containing protein [Polyangium sorediatum]|uniref:Serine/threonine-protein kinase n=1 Tax=Polyangium sorediatum TaxID=889274 RepID=A0ABT6NYJ2_9BACT|nr:serine/threonine-protein kinase [Polyangium sorediatum]MDI1433388.1 serine/threonine-protein kinase [Polyangium sorediatum]
MDDTLPAPTTTSPVAMPPPRRGVPFALHAQYEDIELVGTGGMGNVFRARDKRLGRMVAIKLLKKDAPAARVSFLSEARAQARIEHENVCRVYEVGEADGEPFIAMQFIAGEPLSRAQARMTTAQKVEVMCAVASAVHEAHRQGLVHGDIKPGNILVEARPDGSFKPYVVDFGLAHEVSSWDPAARGAAMGTPAYMAPEQVTRDPRAAEPRTDVYGLGATLYDVLAGRPPYVDDDPWNIVLRLAKEDPEPLGAVVKGVPLELAAIVMRCLAREPSQRYESAGALAEDLGRFLEGEPIAAQRRAPGLGLRWMLRKNRSAVRLVAALLVVAFALTFAWVKQERAVAEQVRLTQEMGRVAMGMELLMRSAYQMPLHDVGRERALVRREIEAIERRMTAASPMSAGPGHYALGRGYLALGEPEAAYQHLERAKAAGYAPPELDYVLGTSLLELYVMHDGGLVRSSSESERDARRADIIERYKKPALAYLRAVLPARIEAPAYAEGLVAFYEGRYEETIAKARAAFAEAPLLYEAKKLEGDALAELALRAWTGGAPDWWTTMTGYLDGAVDAYRVAEDIARSDPRVLEAACSVHTRAMFATSYKGESPRPWFERGRAVCDRLLLADGGSTKARLVGAELRALYAYAVASRMRADERPAEAIEEAVRYGEEALDASGANLRAYMVLGTALRAKCLYLGARGQDARAALERASTIYQEGAREFPRSEVMPDSAAVVYVMQAEQERWRGVDVEATVREGLGILDRVDALGATTAMTHHKRSVLRLARAEQLVDQGRSPAAVVEALLADVQAGAALNPAWQGFAEARVAAHGLMARYALASGADPRDALEKGALALSELRKKDGESDEAHTYRGLWAMLEAQSRLQRKLDPSAALVEARSGYRAAVAAVPWTLSHALGLARVELLAARFAVSRRRGAGAMFEAARAPLLPWISDSVVDPEVHALLAESRALAAEWRAGLGEPAEDDVTQGLAMAGRALALNPRHARALVMRGRLLLVRGRAEQQAAARVEAAKDAGEALLAAFRENPLLASEHGAALEEARKLR